MSQKLCPDKIHTVILLPRLKMMLSSVFIQLEVRLQECINIFIHKVRFIILKGKTGKMSQKFCPGTKQKTGLDGFKYKITPGFHVYMT